MLPKMRWSTMRNDAAYLPGDPVQAEMLAEEALDVLVMKRPIGKPKWATKKARKRRMSRSPPGKGLPAVQCITKAIQDELHAINKYQRYMNDAETRVKELFAILMNEEKEHVAKFTAALFRLTHEPLPEETD